MATVPQGEIVNNTLRTVNTRALRAAREDAALEAEIKAVEAAKHGNVIDDQGQEVSAEDAVTKQIKSLEKRVSDTKSYFQKRENDLVKQVETLQVQLADATKKQIKFPKTEEEVSEWVAKFPDVAAIVETIAMKKVQDLRADVDAQKSDLATQRYEVEFNRQMGRIIGEHGDFPELQSDEDFNEWIQKQPKHIRSVFDSEQPIPYEDLEDAADTAIYALSLYKALTKKPEPKKEVARDAARSVVTRNNSAPPQVDRRPDLVYASDIAKLSNKQYTDEIDAMVNKAMLEGRFVDDIHGAAR